MLALKLKLEPSGEQLEMLDEMFWKWASICNRISLKGVNKEALKPPEGAGGIWFSLTQLNQAKTDVADLRKALKQSGNRMEYELKSKKKRLNEIMEAIRNPAKREQNPARASNFRPKSYAEKGLLKARYHTLRYWQSEADKLSRLISKKENTLKKIEAGRIFFRPKRISLHSGTFQLNFAGRELLLTNVVTNPESMRLRVLTAPEQPHRGSSKNSADWLHEGIVQYVAFALHSLMFGMNRAEEALLKAKKPDKVAKKQEKLANKKAKFEVKLGEMQKWLNRKLTNTEREILEKEYNIFFSQLEGGKNPERTPEYISFISSISSEIVSRDRPFSPDKYPILLRKPLNKKKNIRNLKPDEWEYYLQLSYEPILDKQDTFEPETVMGIDRGIKHLLAISILEPSSGKFVFNKLVDNPIAGWRLKQRKLKRSLQHLERRVRAQQNVHLHENQMKKRLRSIENRVDNLLHNVSSEIVSLAKERKSVIVMENLQSLRQHGRKKNRWTKALNYFLSLFDYGKIAQLISYKAKRAGVPMYDINAFGTSQNCANCLLTERGGKYLRDQQNSKIGRCDKCGQIDADLNAARTIAVCYHKRLNDPQPFGERIVFKRF